MLGSFDASREAAAYPCSIWSDSTSFGPVFIAAILQERCGQSIIDEHIQWQSEATAMVAGQTVQYVRGRLTTFTITNVREEYFTGGETVPGGDGTPHHRSITLFVDCGSSSFYAAYTVEYTRSGAQVDVRNPSFVHLSACLPALSDRT